MDFSKIDEDFGKEIVAGGEAYLDGMLRVATSADQRASSLAGMFVAAATALLAAVVALANPAWNVPGRFPLIAGAAAAAVLFLLGALLCLRAIMPVNFWLPGCEPGNWEDDIKAGKKLQDCLGERAAHIQKHIASNLDVVESNARKFRRGAISGIAAPFVGVLVWIAVSACRWVG
jgi:hypothetical protein